MPVNAVLIDMTLHRSKQGSRGKTMLSPEMKQLIVSHTAGMVGTVDDAGKPAVSPKATFFIVDDATIAYGDIRSPGTRRNIAKRPAVEVIFIDVVYRKAVRVTGTATFIAKSDADVTLLEKFSAEWPNLVSVVSGFVKIKIHAAKMIVSPAYDRGATAEELRVANLAKLNALWSDRKPDLGRVSGYEPQKRNA